MKKISVVILTKNEERNIVDCLENLTWCNEIILIDDDSGDRTVEISQKMGARVFLHSLNGDFTAQRNFGLEKAQGEWVLFVDADERVSAALAAEISNLKSQISNRHDGFYMKRIDFMWGKRLRHGEMGNIKLLRLAKKNAGAWEGKVHEEWKVKGEIGELKNPLLHYPHPIISEFLSKINFYSTIRSQELFDQNIKTSVWQIITYPLGKFVVNYFLKLGFLDGIPGFVVATIMSLHSFLARGKLWLLWNKTN